MRGGNVCSVMRGGRGRCTHHTAARRHSHSHSVCLHHAAHPQSTRTTVLHPCGACPPHTTSHHTRHCPLLTDTLSPQTACSSQATLNTICSSQISNNSLLLTSSTFTVCSSQTGRATQLAPHKRTYTHTQLHTQHNIKHNLASHSASVLLSCLSLNSQTPRTAPKLNYIYSKLTLNYKPIN
jgi:hypothetical protein